MPAQPKGSSKPTWADSSPRGHLGGRQCWEFCPAPPREWASARREAGRTCDLPAHVGAQAAGRGPSGAGAQRGSPQAHGAKVCTGRGGPPRSHLTVLNPREKPLWTPRGVHQSDLKLTVFGSSLRAALLLTVPWTTNTRPESHNPAGSGDNLSPSAGIPPCCHPL